MQENDGLRFTNRVVTCFMDEVMRIHVPRAVDVVGEEGTDVHLPIIAICPRQFVLINGSTRWENFNSERSGLW